MVNAEDDEIENENKKSRPAFGTMSADEELTSLLAFVFVIRCFCFSFHFFFSRDNISHIWIQTQSIRLIHVLIAQILFLDKNLSFLIHNSNDVINIESIHWYFRTFSFLRW